VKCAGECAAAQELDRLRALFHEIGKRLHEILVEVVPGDVPRPGVDCHFGDFQVVPTAKPLNIGMR